MSECNHDCENCENRCDQECSHDCANCDGNCDHKIVKATPLSGVKIKKVIGILSGKGGVGKSTVSSLLAVELAKKGYKVGIMDADITGPSMQKVFNVNEPLGGDQLGIFPYETGLGIKIVSINMMFETEDTPVLWRGPIIGGVVTQFYDEVHWGELDYLLIDMPPGTSDVAITVLQTIPVDGLIMVTSPSKLVGMIVGKTINLARAVNIEVIGLVENMAYVKCPNCNEMIKLYRDDDTDDTAAKYDLKILARVPIDPELSNLMDEGEVEQYAGDYLKGVVEEITQE